MWVENNCFIDDKIERKFEECPKSTDLKVEKYTLR